MHLKRFVFVFFVSFVFQACRSQPSEPQPIVAVTKVVGSWSGRGTRTVGDVPSETGRFRIVWQTSNESPPGSGTFRLTLRSAISGRTIGIVADTTGVGSGTAHYDEGPRTYDFLVESTNVDWTFRVEETSGEYRNKVRRGGTLVPPSRAGLKTGPYVHKRSRVFLSGVRASFHTFSTYCSDRGRRCRV